MRNRKPQKKYQNGKIDGASDVHKLFADAQQIPL